MKTQIIESLIKNPLKKLANYYIDNKSRFFINTAAFGYSLGSVGLILGLLINKEVPEKEKRFMIFQEGVEGVLDFGVFLLAGRKFEDWGEKLVKNGNLLPKNLKTIDMKKFTEGTKVASSMLGMLLAFNIISPLIRNKLASTLDKRFQKNEPTLNNISAYNKKADILNSYKNGVTPQSLRNIYFSSGLRV